MLKGVARHFVRLDVLISLQPLYPPYHHNRRHWPLGPEQPWQGECCGVRKIL